MKRIQKLFVKNLLQIENSTWYRQRFDACPHFMFFLGDAHISSIQHTKFPFGQRIAYAGFSKNRADWYHSYEELEFTAEHIISAAKRTPKLSKKMIREFMPWQKKFYDYCKTIDNLNLSELSNSEILKIYNELSKIYTNKLNSSPLIDGFALSTDTLIRDKLKLFLQEKKLEKHFGKYFDTLTAPVFLSFLQEEENNLLKLVKLSKKYPTKTKTLLAKHQRNYFWIQNNYVSDNILEHKDFEVRYKKLAKGYVNNKIEALLNFSKRHKIAKEYLIKKIQLPKELKTLIQITDDFNWWQDERKKGTFWATHYFSMLLTEISNRTKYPLHLLKYALPPEMKDAISGKLKVSQLKKRYDYCMIIWKKDSYDVITDKKFIKKLDQIGTGSIVKVAKEDLRGSVASRGIVRGKVKICLSVEEIHKVGKGDVLVAVMTRPDYLAAMKKAIAFVTDEGGITCHAAIVAREMKKPCVIGTKIATKVLKDGDLVEVDANHGVIKKIT